MVIGICDDSIDEQKKVSDICREILTEQEKDFEIIKFSTGQQLIDYCNNDENNEIDLLFLDIELGQMNGIDIKDRIIKSDKIWRISFVSGYNEYVYDAYSIKTIGFILKPAYKEQIKKMINIVIDEKEENIAMSVRDSNNKIVKVQAEDIIYIKAEGNYSEIYTYSKIKNLCNYILCTKKLGIIEKELDNYLFVRVHKSYIVNLQNVDYISGNSAIMKDNDKGVPIGRKYNEKFKIQYNKYVKKRVLARL